MSGRSWLVIATATAALVGGVALVRRRSAEKI